MPFTPYHFGPGLLVKAALPRHCSFGAFVATQVVIDCETLYHMLRHEYPLHRLMHTYVVATVVGVGSGLVLFVAMRGVRRLAAQHDAANRWLLRWRAAETSLNAAVCGGMIGGISHVWLDSMMHSDIRPGWPFSQTNPMLGATPIETLHSGCVAAGILALLLVAVREFARRGRAPDRKN